MYVVRIDEIGGSSVFFENFATLTLALQSARKKLQSDSNLQVTIMKV